jgi:hypothetical protein
MSDFLSLGIMNSASDWYGPYGAYMWQSIDPAQLQNRLASLANYNNRTALDRQRRVTAAHWFVDHYRQRAKESGVQAAARQMRKQGVPVEVAISILATR